MQITPPISTGINQPRKHCCNSGVLPANFCDALTTTAMAVGTGALITTMTIEGSWHFLKAQPLHSHLCAHCWAPCDLHGMGQAAAHRCSEKGCFVVLCLRQDPLQGAAGLADWLLLRIRSAAALGASRAEAFLVI